MPVASISARSQQGTDLPARPHGRGEAPTCGGDRRSRALDSPGEGCRVAHKEVLLHLAAEGWVRWSNTVCAALREPDPMSPSRVAETLANGLAADPLFCDLLANLHLHLHLEHEVDLD